MSEYDVKGCGCCTDGQHATPPGIFNRPALKQIRYRIGDYGSFRRAMLDAIPTKSPLAAWTARDETDYGIALIDMWAYLGDILTFYQERIANEAFLRTAVHRESVMRLAALLDYRPSPGAAAVAYVAFVLEKGKTLQIPIGLRLQSVPGQNEKPQKFETVEGIKADAALNAVRIHGVPVAFNPFAKGSKGGPLTESIAAATAGTPLVVWDPSGVEMKNVAAVLDDGDTVTLEWAPPIFRSNLTPLTTRAAAWSRQFALFGSETPAKTMLATILDPNSDKVGIQYTERETEFGLTDPWRYPLDRDLPDLKAGMRVLLVRASETGFPAATRVATVYSVESKPFTMRTTNNVALTPYAAKVTELTLDIRVASKPAGVQSIGAGLALAAIADDGALWVRKGGPDWMSWQSTGGNFVDCAMTALDAPLGVQYFGREANGTVNLLTSAGWTFFGSGLDALNVGVTQNRAYAVARSIADSKVLVKRQDAAHAWSFWQPLDGPACDLVTAITNNAGSIEIFVRDKTTREVWTRREVTPFGAWTAWQNIHGVVLDLTAGTNANGTVEAFARGLDSALWRSRRTGNTWSGWTSLGGWIDLMTVARDAQGRLNAFARGADKRVWTKRQTAPNTSTWTAWSSTASDFVDSLTAFTDASHNIHVLVDAGFALKEYTASWHDLGPPMWPIHDRRRVSVYELASDPLPFAASRYPDSVSGSPVAIPLARLASIESGRTIILDDAAKQPHTATVTSSQVSGSHLRVSFSPGLPRPLSGTSATLYGNIAKVTHGETKNEILGNGDAAARFQTFRVPKAPVTFVPQAGARNGVANTLEVRVDGVKWSEVDTLLDHTKDDRVFATILDEKDTMTVQFGGEPGARLPTGRSNVTAKYRVGLGAEGNVRAGALSNLLDRPPGLKSAVNPAGAEGGAGSESPDGIRSNAPNTVRTFNRIVSLRDFEDAAREHASVAKARAVWRMEDYERVVSLTVAAENGAVLGDSARASIAADLDAKRDVNRPLHVRSHLNVPFVVTAIVQVDSAYLTETVQKNALDAVAAYFAFAGRELGQPVHLSDVYARIQAVAGVVAVRIVRLRRKSGGAEVGDHVLLESHEMAMLAAPGDAVVTAQFESL